MKRRSPLWLAMVGGAALWPAAVEALDLARGPLPLSVENSAVVACGSRCELIIEGRVNAPKPVTLVLRMDDAGSTSYATRFNEERELPPGNFRWRRPMAGLRTSGGAPLDVPSLSRVMLFLGGGAGEVTVSRLSLVEAKSLPEGSLGLSFGAPEAPIPPGFERVSIGDPRIGGSAMAVVRRPQPDPLVANGIKGLERLRIQWPPGRVRVSFWTEDPGEWEHLPHPLERRIRVNGVDALLERASPVEWIAKRYLAGANREVEPGEGAWMTFGRHRSEPASVEVEVRDRGLAIDLAGDSPDATFLSALLVEPAGQNAVLDQVLRQRRAWYDENWPVGAPHPTRVSHEASLLATADRAAQIAPPLTLTLASGTGARAAALVSTEEALEAPDVTIRPPELDGRTLGVTVWAAQRVLDRVSAGSTLLTLKDDRLRAGTGLFPVTSEQPRRYEFWVSAPDATPPGRYAGEIAIGQGARRATLPLEIEVLPTVLPPVSRQAGFYLDEAPHLGWFPWKGDARRQQISCDLAVLSALAIRGNAPALSTPAAKRDETFLADVRSASQNANVMPALAYAPAKRVAADVGLARSAEVIADAERMLTGAGFPGLIWSVADEPSNPEGGAEHLSEWLTALRRAAPNVRLAAHLNTQADRASAALFDTVLINQGYGIDTTDIAALRARKVDAWLYNTARPRWTAGFWLWRTGASRYLQWHARMPTADPFDPTDGREGDVQMFLPTLEPCPPQPDINADVLAMAEGLVDQRWLLWLESRREPDAARLLADLQAAAGDRFELERVPDDAAIDALRQRVISLARRLN